MGDSHDFRGGTALAKELGHDPHGTVDVREESPETLAQDIEARLSVGAGARTVLGAAAVADKAHGALAAKARQGAGFVLPEGSLSRGGDKIPQVPLADVAQLVAEIGRAHV